MTLSSGNQTIHSLTIAADDSLKQAGTGALTVAAASTVAGVMTLSGSSGGVTFNDSTSIGSLNLSGATLSGDGDVSIANVLAWGQGDGSMSGTGKTIIAPGATLNINGDVNHLLSRYLENDGNILWSDGTIEMINGTIQNNGTFTASQSSGIQEMSAGGGVNAFNNAGIFIDSGGADVETGGGLNTTFNSSGTIDAGARTIELTRGGTFAATAKFAGKVRLDPGETVVFTDTVNVSGTLTIGASFVADTPLAFIGSGVVLLQGSLAGNADVTFDATLNWVSGSMTGSGRIIIPADSQLILSSSIGAPAHVLGRVLENDGSAVWSGGAMTMVNGTFQNNGFMQTGAGTGGLSSTGNGGVNAFNNTGTFTNLVNTTVSFGFASGGSSGIPFNNTGFVDGGSGQLDIDAGGTNGPGATFAGTITMGALSMAGVNIFVGAITVNGPLKINSPSSIDSDATFSGTGVVTLGITLTGAGDATFNTKVVWNSGTMSGTGRTIIGPAGTLELRNVEHDLQRTLENDGETDWYNGNIVMAGGTIQNNGIFDIQPIQQTPNRSLLASGGVNAFNNSGTVSNLSALTLFVGTVLGGSEVPLNNSGTVDGGPAGIYLGGGGTHSAGATFAGLIGLGGTNAFSGAPNIAGTVTIQAGVTIDSSVTFAGAGSVSIASNLSGSGDLTFALPVEWSNGVMSGTGKTIIAPTGSLNLKLNGLPASLNRVLENYGTVNGTLGILTMNGGDFENYGLFTSNSTGTLSFNAVAGVNLFNNAGTFTNLGAGSPQFAALVPFVNSGFVDIEAGTFIVNSPITMTGVGYLDGAQAAALAVGGNLLGDATNPDEVNGLGTVLFNGSGTAAAPQLLEATSDDLGNVAAGFSHNFAFNTLSVAGITYVKLVDQSDNAAGAGPEAVYVDTLIVPAGSTLDLNGLHLYARNIQVAGAILNGQVSQVLPAVEQVLVAGSAWSPAFLDQLRAAGLGNGGYAIPGNAIDQLAPLPWSGLDEIKIAFNEDVNVQAGSLAITSATSGAITPVAFAYDVVSHIATWTLAQPIGNDNLTLSLTASGPAAVTDVHGTALDGEWPSTAAGYPSGDNVAGGEFDFNFNVLPGDVTQDGIVDIQDLTNIANHWLQPSPLSDPAASGKVDIVDLTLIANNWQARNSGAPVEGALLVAVVPAPTVSGALTPAAPIEIYAPQSVTAPAGNIQQPSEGLTPSVVLNGAVHSAPTSTGAELEVNRAVVAPPALYQQPPSSVEDPTGLLDSPAEISSQFAAASTISAPGAQQSMSSLAQDVLLSPRATDRAQPGAVSSMVLAAPAALRLTRDNDSQPVRQKITTAAALQTELTGATSNKMTDRQSAAQIAAAVDTLLATVDADGLFDFDRLSDADGNS